MLPALAGAGVTAWFRRHETACRWNGALLTLFGREHRAEVYRGLAAAAGVQVSPRSCWLLYRIADHGAIAKTALARLLGITSAHLDERMTELTAAGSHRRRSAGGDEAPADGTMALTQPASRAAGQMYDARAAGIDRLATVPHPQLRLLGRSPGPRGHRQPDRALTRRRGPGSHPAMTAAARGRAGLTDT